MIPGKLWEIRAGHTLINKQVREGIRKYMWQSQSDVCRDGPCWLLDSQGSSKGEGLPMLIPGENRTMLGERRETLESCGMTMWWIMRSPAQAHWSQVAWMGGVHTSSILRSSHMALYHQGAELGARSAGGFHSRSKDWGREGVSETCGDEGELDAVKWVNERLRVLTSWWKWRSVSWGVAETARVQSSVTYSFNKQLLSIYDVSGICKALQFLCLRMSKNRKRKWNQQSPLKRTWNWRMIWSFISYGVKLYFHLH